jgi:ATPase subunit of ABC transporter with duplicated ATPase domains
VRVGYLAQDLAVAGGQTLAAFVVNSVPGRAELDARLAETEADLAARRQASRRRPATRRSTSG